MGAVVTASGTGAEMNNGAVITNEDTNEKAGVLGAFARFAVLDVDYIMSLPAKQVISGAFDTLSHSMETYLGSPRDLTLSDELAEAVMRNVIRNIRVLMNDIYDKKARTELMWASAVAENGILKIGKVTDFQAHQIEHQLGAYTDCNHGQGLADFILEIGLPATFTEMGITDESVLKKVADTCNLTAGCCRKLSREELLEILKECW